jgi:hypothetical protein
VTWARKWVAVVAGVLAGTAGLSVCAARSDGQVVVPGLPVQNCAGEGEHAQRATVPAWIDASGTVDVTFLLSFWLMSLPDGTVADLAGGTFRAEQPILLRDTVELTVDGNNATLLRTEKGPADGTARGTSSITVEDGRDFVVKDLSVVGGHDGPAPGIRQYQVEYEAQHGVNVEGTQGVTICDMDIGRVLGDFVYLGPSGIREARVCPVDVHVYGNRFWYSGRQGVAVTCGSNIVYAANLFVDAGRSTLDVEPNSDILATHDVVFDGNLVFNGVRFYSSLGSAALVEGVALTNNTLIGTPFLVSIVGQRDGTNRRDVVIANNRSDTAQEGDRLIWLVDVQNVWVVANVLAHNGRDHPEIEAIRVTGLIDLANVFFVP